VIKGDLYPQTATFRLESRDSGTEGGRSSTLLRQQGSVFSGAMRLQNWASVKDASVRALLPAAVRERVLQADFAASCVTNLGPLVLGGFAAGAASRPTPFPNSTAMAHLNPSREAPAGSTSPMSPPNHRLPATESREAKSASSPMRRIVRLAGRRTRALALRLLLLELGRLL